MKTVSVSPKTSKAIYAFVACMPIIAVAGPQSVIVSVSVPYLSTPEIKFSIDDARPRLAGARPSVAQTQPPREVFLSPTVEVITPATEVSAAVKAPTLWTLAAGSTVGRGLQLWGEKAGWQVVWSLTKDWAVPAATSFTGDFQAAAGDVIKTLAANGALIHAQFYEGNRTMVISGPGVAAQ